MYVSEWENGRRAVSAEYATVLRALLGLTDAELFGESQPAAETLVCNLLRYVSTWKPTVRRKVLYAGDEAGKSHLEAMGLFVRIVQHGSLSDLRRRLLEDRDDAGRRTPTRSELDRACPGPPQARERERECGLPRSVGPGHREPCPRLELEREIAEHGLGDAGRSAIQGLININ